MFIQALESRRLMSVGGSLSHGVLTIMGTDLDDIFHVYRSGESLNVSVETTYPPWNNSHPRRHHHVLCAESYPLDRH